MNANRVRQRVQAGKPCIGCFLGLGSPSVAEMLARAGMDWLVIETEHNALDSAEVQQMLMAMNGTDATPIVRVPNQEQLHIQRALDLGAMGILVPNIRTADEARAVVSYTRYPPEGVRSWGPLRASGYTFGNDDYLAKADENMLVCLILETREAVDNLEEICAVPGVDVLTIGPWDLSLSLGLDPRGLPLPEVDAITRRAAEVGARHGVAIGVAADTPEGLRELQRQGYFFIQYGPEYVLFANAVRAGLEAFDRGE